LNCIKCEWDQAYARGLCRTCYDRAYRRGNLEEVAGKEGKGGRMRKPHGWVQVGDWVQELEPDMNGKRLFGQAMKTKGSATYDMDGEKWVNVRLAYTRQTVPIRVANLMGYDGPIPDPIPEHKLPKFDMREILGCCGR
jgi:hypothetical protein